MAEGNYNRHQPLYPLSERGYRQAQRNNSHQMYPSQQADGVS